MFEFHFSFSNGGWGACKRGKYRSGWTGEPEKTPDRLNKFMDSYADDLKQGLNRVWASLDSLTYKEIDVVDFWKKLTTDISDRLITDATVSDITEAYRDSGRIMNILVNEYAHENNKAIIFIPHLDSFFLPSEMYKEVGLYGIDLIKSHKVGIIEFTGNTSKDLSDFNLYNVSIYLSKDNDNFVVCDFTPS